MKMLKEHQDGRAIEIVDEETNVGTHFFQDELAQWFQDELNQCETEEQYQEMLTNATEVADRLWIEHGGHIEE